MKHGLIIESLQQRIRMGLPGQISHFKMLPAERRSSLRPVFDSLEPKQSSVLILLFPLDDFLGTILIKRTEDNSVHSGQISFPGGRREESDASHIQTALREAEEETGIRPEKIRIIGELSPLYVSPSNFMIYPVIGYNQKRPDLLPNPSEVECIIEISLKNLETFRTVADLEVRGYKFSQVPCFSVNGHIVWGATAMIIQELMDVFAAMQ